MSDNAPTPELVALLACPFCGGEAHLIGKDGPYHGRAVVCVAGGGCTASLGEKYDRDGCDDHYFTSKQEAITAWNTRAATLPQGVWISVEDRLPDCDRRAGSLGIECIVHPKIQGQSTAFYGKRIKDRGGWYYAGAAIHDVTHWQPLPPPPPADILIDDVPLSELQEGKEYYASLTPVQKIAHDLRNGTFVGTTPPPAELGKGDDDGR